MAADSPEPGVDRAGTAQARTGAAGAPGSADSIVIGYDASDAGADALVLGARLAAAVGASAIVTVVHPQSPPGLGHVDAEWLAALRQDAAEQLDTAKALLGEVVPAEFRSIGAGSPAQGLDALAESVGAEAIVVGSARTGPLRRLLAGSTAQRLLHGASVPVLLAPHRQRPALTEPVQVVGCAFLDTPDGREALRVAADLATRARARLRVLTVVAPAGEFSHFGARDVETRLVAAAREEYQQALDRAIDGLGPGVPASGELLAGHVVEALAALDDRDLDLLVCGSRGYGPVRRVLLGGTSSRLVHRAAAPVMVVPRPGHHPRH